MKFSQFVSVQSDALGLIELKVRITSQAHVNANDLFRSLFW